VQEDSGHRDSKLIGIYSTPERAREAIHRLRDQPGFKAFPEGWEIQERTLDQDSWTQGFVTETHKPI